MPRDLDSPASQFPPPVLTSVACTVTAPVAVMSLALVPDEKPEPDCHTHGDPTVPEPVAAPYGALSVTGGPADGVTLLLAAVYVPIPLLLIPATLNT